VNQEPTASFTFTTTDLQAFFTDTSTDPDGTVVSWSWDFGDGTGTSQLQNPSYTYASAGTYPVTLTVTDNEGGTDFVTQDVTVADPGVNQEDLQAFFTDTSTDPDGTVVSWSWDFGDGTGTSVLKNPSYTYASAGTYPVSLTVTDNEGAANTTTQNVSVTDPVVVTGIVPASLAAGSSIEVTITGSGFIPGATLTFEGGSGPSPSASNVIVAANGITITATITAKAGGPRRNRVWDVRVVNPDGGSGVLPGGLTITNSR
jgi:PKD repeat protein